MLRDKFKAYSYGHELIKRNKAFLSNRVQIVSISEASSESVAVLSGVIQGTVKGNIFFLDFVKNYSKYLFVKDLKIAERIINYLVIIAIKNLKVMVHNLKFREHYSNINIKTQFSCSEIFKAFKFCYNFISHESDHALRAEVI